MSRVSSNLEENSYVRTGYDYQLQCWVKDFMIQDCGHPENMDCNCVARKFQGQDIRKVYSLALFHYQSK